MNEPDDNVRRRPAGFGLAVAALLLAFSLPLYHLAGFALRGNMYSYIVLVPLISVGLAWFKRPELPSPSVPDRRISILLGALGLAVLASYWLPASVGFGWSSQDYLILNVLAFVLLFGGVCGWFLGNRTWKALSFPLGFLLFMVPFPVAFTNWFEAFLQHTSAAVAYFFFELSGMPVFQPVSLRFQLPGMSLEVAPQCSGLNSSLALFITSLAAGYVFLRSPWKRTALSLATIPLGILRNGFRIFTIGELCVHIGPQMIDSYIHRTGGWVFFLLSLVPLFLLLLFLMRSERPASNSNAKLAEA